MNARIHADEIDYVDLGSFCCGEVTLSARQHRIVAMIADGFSDDGIIAEHLNDKKRDVQTIIGRLKRRYGWHSRNEIIAAYKAMKKIVWPK